MDLALILSPGIDISPNFFEHQLPSLVLKNYGLTVTAFTQLDGYDDKNYYIQVGPEKDNPHISEIWEHGYTFKILNSLDSKNTTFIDGQHELMHYLDKNGIKVPLPVKNVKGGTFSVETFEDGKGHVVRLLTYLPGSTLGKLEPTQKMNYNVGNFVGKLSNILKDFKHPSYESRRSIWMLESVLSIRQFLQVIVDERRLHLVTDVLQQFEESVLPNLSALEKGTLHGDVNEHNIIVNNEEVDGLLDFGDSHYSALLFELGICICYILIHNNSIEVGKSIVQGYLQNRKLTSMEKDLLKVTVCARLCQSLVLGLYSSSLHPENSYITGTQKNGWRLLQELNDLTNQQIFEYWNLN